MGGLDGEKKQFSIPDDYEIVFLERGGGREMEIPEKKKVYSFPPRKPKKKSPMWRAMNRRFSRIKHFQIRNWAFFSGVTIPFANHPPFPRPKKTTNE